MDRYSPCDRPQVDNCVMSPERDFITRGGVGRGQLMDRAFTRRAALLSGAAVVLVACRALPAHPAKSGASPSSPQGVLVVSDTWYYNIVPGLAAAFNVAHQKVAVKTSTVRPLGIACPYSVGSLSPSTLSLKHSTQIPIDGPLRAGNFDPNTVQTGLLDGFRWHGQQYGLPMQQYPLAVRWRRDVFAAAQLTPPDAEWTIDDFLTACAVIADLIPAKKVPGLRAVLPPFQSYRAGDRGGSMNGFLWPGFAIGYGGSIVQKGVFRFDSKALIGLAAFVDLARRFGADASTEAATIGDTSGYAMVFDAWRPPKLVQTTEDSKLINTSSAMAFDSLWSYARLPRFSVRPVIPTSVTGVGVTGPSNGDPNLLSAAVETLTWLYSAQAQTSLRAWGAVPVLADMQAQSPFWDLQSPEDQAVGDWNNFLAYDAGWPADIGPYVSAALVAAMNDPSQLQTQIASAVEKMNAAVQATTQSA